MQKKGVNILCHETCMSCLQLKLSLMQEAASHEAVSREEQPAPRSQHVSTSNAALTADGVTDTMKRSARHAQDPLAKKGSSSSRPALAEAPQPDASRAPRTVRRSWLCVLPGFWPFLQHFSSPLFVCLSVCVCVCLLSCQGVCLCELCHC